MTQRLISGFRLAEEKAWKVNLLVVGKADGRQRLRRAVCKHGSGAVAAGQQSRYGQSRTRAWRGPHHDSRYLSPQQAKAHLDLLSNFNSSSTISLLPIDRPYRYLDIFPSIDFLVVTLSPASSPQLSPPAIYCSTNRTSRLSCPSSGIPSVAPRTLRVLQNPNLTVAMALPRVQSKSRSLLNTN